MKSVSEVEILLFSMDFSIMPTEINQFLEVFDYEEKPAKSFIAVLVISDDKHVGWSILT